VPATNIHVQIGRNGVGKTRCFDFLACAFLRISWGIEDPNAVHRYQLLAKPVQSCDHDRFPGRY
jgi:hypothetical protein